MVFFRLVYADSTSDTHPPPKTKAISTIKTAALAAFCKGLSGKGLACAESCPPGVLTGLLSPLPAGQKETLNSNALRLAPFLQPSTTRIVMALLSAYKRIIIASADLAKATSSSGFFLCLDVICDRQS